PDAVDRLPRPATCEDDVAGFIEDDDGLAAFLDERAPTKRVRVHGSHRTYTRFAHRFRPAHGAQTHMSVNPSTTHLGKGGTMRLKWFALVVASLAALAFAAVASAAVILG